MFVCCFISTLWRAILPLFVATPPTKTAAVCRSYGSRSVSSDKLAAFGGTTAFSRVAAVRQVNAGP
jgi:hypothetical protein